MCAKASKKLNSTGGGTKFRDKCGTFEAWVEIPVTVHYEAFASTGDGRNEPHIPASIEVTQVDLPKDLASWILDNHNESLREWAIEDAE